MAGIAEILLNLNYSVSGSDIARNSLIDHLEELGARVAVGHAAENVRADTSVMVVSSAISPENPEIEFARNNNIPVIPRAEMLAELMRMKYGLAVAGSHGKTTTTSMLAKMLTDAGFDPTVIIGGRVLTKRSGAKLGKGEYLVAEADESDGSFGLLRPAISIVTNIDAEHLNHYGSFGELEMAFGDFMASVPFYGAVVACFDDPIVANLARKLKRRVISYGLAPGSDVTATDLVAEGASTSFNLLVGGKQVSRVKLPLPGSHMVSNSLAAVAVGIELGIDFEKICFALESFPGVARRSELIGINAGVAVLDDYAHHPTEIKATLSALRAGWLARMATEQGASTMGRLVVLFQPHRYSRTKDLFSQFVEVFGDADELIVGDIYAAGEKPIEGVTGENLALAIKHTRVSYVSDLKNAVAPLASKLRAGDVVVTIGAGNVGQVAKEIAKTLGA